MAVRLDRNEYFVSAPLPRVMITSIGIAVPRLYATVNITADAFTVLVAASVMTDAMIGPTHGVHTSPRLKPKSTPPLNPLFDWDDANRLISLLAILSNACCNFGMTSAAPSASMMMTEVERRMSGDAPVYLTSVARERVKNEKLATNPTTTPYGLYLPPAIPPLRTSGRMGKIHGDRIVTNPPANANKVSNIIL